MSAEAGSLEVTAAVQARRVNVQPMTPGDRAPWGRGKDMRWGERGIRPQSYRVTGWSIEKTERAPPLFPCGTNSWPSTGPWAHGHRFRDPAGPQPRTGLMDDPESHDPEQPPVEEALDSWLDEALPEPLPRSELGRGGRGRLLQVARSFPFRYA